LTVLRELKRFYATQMAHPGVAGLFVNPFYFARRGLHAAVQELGRELGGRVLDVGCGDRPYETLIPSREYIGLDLDTPESRARGKADAFYEGRTFPFADGYFDAVVCNQVLEHVFEPDAFVEEIARVLKAGGRLLLTVPFAWDEHEQPRDYARYSSFGLAALLQRHGFSILHQRKTAADVTALFQMVNAYLYKVTATRNAYANLLAALVLMAPFNLLGTVVAWITPDNPDFFLDNVVLAERRVPAA
jgi:SAM-dependent methyltransferase